MLASDTVGVKQERLSLLTPQFSGSHRGEISSFYLPTDSGIRPAQRFRSSHALERC